MHNAHNICSSLRMLIQHIWQEFVESMLRNRSKNILLTPTYWNSIGIMVYVRYRSNWYTSWNRRSWDVFVHYLWGIICTQLVRVGSIPASRYTRWRRDRKWWHWKGIGRFYTPWLWLPMRSILLLRVRICLWGSGKFLLTLVSTLMRKKVRHSFELKLSTLPQSTQ